MQFHWQEQIIDEIDGGNPMGSSPNDSQINSSLKNAPIRTGKALEKSESQAFCNCVSFMSLVPA
jgi:hypothetical protein